MTPAVSLVIPSYRRGAKIGPTLSSVFAQTRPPAEVLVVNDGGFADTTAFVREHYPAARVLDIPHGGAAAARNTGVEAAAGPVVVLLDDDDTLRPTGVEVLVRTLTTFPEARAAHADHTFTDLRTGFHQPNHHATPAFARLARVRPRREAGGVRLFDKRLYYAMLSGNLLQQPWAVYRDAYRAVGGFQPGLVSADDWDVYLRVVRRFPVALTDEIVGDHFLEPGRQHLTTDPRQRQGQMEAARRHLALAGWRDVRAAVSLRHTLGLHHKALGDEAGDAATAWREYRRAAWYWPFDPVVVARAAVVMPFTRLRGILRGAGR